VLTPSGSAPKGGPRHPHVIEITDTWSLNLPMPAEMRIRLLGKKFFQRWILSRGIISGRRQASCGGPHFDGVAAHRLNFLATTVQTAPEPHSTGRKSLL
jgi:hypothetical protein